MDAELVELERALSQSRAQLPASLRRRVLAACHGTGRSSTRRSDPGALDQAQPSDRADSDHVGAVAMAFDLLPRPQRELLALKIDGDLTFAQVAVILNVSAEIAASGYRDALAALRTLLAELWH